MNNPTPTRSEPRLHQPWRVILVGRTGLDQTLRRDRNIELIRCRDSIDAIGELGDPIDHESPAQAVVIVAIDAIEDDPDARMRFADALRLVDRRVRVILVADDPDDAFDACVRRDQPLDQLIETIANCIDAQPRKPVPLRLIHHTEDRNPNQSHETRPNEPSPPPQAPEPQRRPSREPEPEITVVAKNDDFQRRARRECDEADLLHRRIILGETEHAPELAPAHTPDTPVIHDDEPVVHAMLKGRPILEPALARINARLGRDDITMRRPEQVDPETAVPVVVGKRTVGYLACDDQRWFNASGRSLLTAQARWLATWIKLETQQQELRRCAFTDPLTGAWNRRYFDRFLSAAIEQSRRARRPLTVMVFDIDSFKHYNDTYGHGAGDEILSETVKLLQSVIRPSDRVCRVGGDEFAVIFYEPQGPREEGSKPLDSIYQIARRFQAQICRHRFPKLGAEALGTLTISGGLASYPWDGHDASSLLEAADRCAMESKRQGKNAITFGPGAESVCRPDRRD